MDDSPDWQKDADFAALEKLARGAIDKFSPNEEREPQKVEIDPFTLLHLLWDASAHQRLGDMREKNGRPRERQAPRVTGRGNYLTVTACTYSGLRMHLTPTVGGTLSAGLNNTAADWWAFEIKRKVTWEDAFKESEQEGHPFFGPVYETVGKMMGMTDEEIANAVSKSPVPAVAPELVDDETPF